MVTKENGILIGIHYEYPFGGMATRPEWLPKGEADWQRDLAMIKETGFDSLRIRIGLDSTLDEVARLLDIAHELGLSVLFGFATFYVSDDFIEECPDARIVDRQGRAYPADKYDYRWQRGCINHPEFRKRRNQMVEECVKRFDSHPAVIDWDIHNEPSIGPGDCSCYCEHTVALYRADLAQRFASVDEINRRWGKAFASFDQVEPPHEIEADPESFWRDWREFMARNLARFLLEGKEIIKRHAPHRRVSFNYTDPFHIQHSAQDWWLLPELDYASASHYRGSNEFTGATANVPISLMRALVPDKEIWLTEFQGGPFTLIGGIIWRGKQIEAEVSQVFSRASRALYFYRWEPLMMGAEPWINGMVDADTYDTERRLATKQVIANIRQYEGVIATGKNVRPRVGIYVTREMVWVGNANKIEMDQAVRGLYGLFLDLGYEATFITDTLSADCDLAVVAVPFTLSLSAAEQEALRSYVERGGRVLMEMPMTSLEDCQRVGGWLGMNCTEWVRPIYWLAGWSLYDSAGKFGGFVFHDRVVVDRFEGEAFATYQDNGAPAMITSGPEGRWLTTTFGLGHTYHTSLHRGVRRLIQSWLPADLKPDIEIVGVPDEYRSLVEARVVESEQGNLLFVINRSGYDWEIEVTPRGYAPVTVKLPDHGARQLFVTKVNANHEMRTREGTLADA
jgi:beta-galactosidase GanA